jgi:hypothetical protein
MIIAQLVKIISSSIPRKIQRVAINAHKTVLNVIILVNCAQLVHRDSLLWYFNKLILG